MNIRPYAEHDRREIIDLWRSCDLIKPWNDPIRDIARKLSVDPERFLVAEIDDHVIDSIMFGYDGHRGWINYLAVSRPHRRQGYGALLMARAESMLRQTGCPKINLQLRTSNASTIGF
jgi:ribosomal protein S18 acetylase RimI-like enzyme